MNKSLRFFSHFVKLNIHEGFESDIANQWGRSGMTDAAIEELIELKSSGWKAVQEAWRAFKAGEDMSEKQLKIVACGVEMQDAWHAKRAGEVLNDRQKEVVACGVEKQDAWHAKRAGEVLNDRQKELVACGVELQNAWHAKRAGEVLNEKQLKIVAGGEALSAYHKKGSDERLGLEISTSNCLEFICSKPSCNNSRLRKSDRVVQSVKYPNAGVAFVEIRDEAAGPIIHRCRSAGNNGKHVRDWMKGQKIKDAKSYPVVRSIFAAVQNASGGKINIGDGKEVVKSYHIKVGERPKELIVTPTCSTCGVTMSLVPMHEKEFYRLINKKTIKRILDKQK